jgi:hypothetical protein
VCYRWAFERFINNGKPYTNGPVPLHTSVEFKLMYMFHSTIPSNWAASEKGTPIEELLTDAMSKSSGRFGACHTPAFLRSAEIGSIEWGRSTGCASYNDLRECFGLPRFTTWAQVNSDLDVQASLASLYPGGVEDLELYVGVSVEETVPGFVPGAAGWSMPTTLFVAIQGDAIAAGIGDRFHTREFSPEALTDWGYAHALSSGRLAVLINRHTTLQVALGTDLFHVPDLSPPPEITMTDHTARPRAHHAQVVPLDADRH